MATLTGSSGNDTLIFGFGQGGLIDGLEGDDSLLGYSNTDTIFGGAGNDTIRAGGGGNDQLFGGTGADQFIVSRLSGTPGINLGNTTVDGGEADAAIDTVTFAAHDKAVSVTYTGNEAASFTDGSSGGQFTGIEAIIMTAFNDVVNASADTAGVNVSAGNGNDSVLGGAGNDILDGGNGNDTIDGGAGNDSVIGGAGNDSVSGGTGNDTLNGWWGSDAVYGGDDADVIYGAAGDTVFGGEGVTSGADNDTLVLQYGTVQSISYGGGTNEAGTVTFTAASGGGSMTFSEVERIQYAGAVDGTSGDDLIVPTYADDQGDLVDGADGNNDTILANDGADTIDAGAGNDLIYAGAGDDLISIRGGSAGTVTIYGESGSDFVAITTTLGNHYIELGLSDAANPYLGDVVDFEFAQTLDLTYTTASGGTVTNGTETLTFSNVDGWSGIFDFGGTFDARLLQDYGVEVDLEDGGWATIYGSNQSDAFTFEDANNRWIDAGAGDDFIGIGYDDVTYGTSTGDDTFFGGAGNDVILGGDGNDVLEGGDGADTLHGQNDRDTIYAGIGDVVDGGEGGEDYDTLDLTAWGHPATNIIYDFNNPENGTVEFLDVNGNVVGTMTFTNIENVVACFTPGAMVLTEMGEVAVESLVAGDRVLTRDSGFQTIRWVGRRDLTLAELIVEPRFNPVFIGKGALGAGVPERDMMVSPQHRMLICSPRAELMFGEHEVLVAAKHLVGLTGIEQRVCKTVSYIHLLFDQHEIVRADGAWSESFQPGAQTLEGMGREQMREIITLFPELEQGKRIECARLSLKRSEARVL